MFGFLASFLIYSALKYASASPTNAVTITSHPISFASAPTLAPPIQFILEPNGHLRPRQRKVLGLRSRELENPVPDKMGRNHYMTRIPSEEQLSIIKKVIRDHMAGSPYMLGADGKFSATEKPQGTLKYYFGKVEVFDEEGYSIYETSCCYGFPRSNCACFSCTNCAEYSTTSAACILCCPLLVSTGLCSFGLELSFFGDNRLSGACIHTRNSAYGRLSAVANAGYNAWQTIRARRNPTVAPVSSEIQLPWNCHYKGPGSLRRQLHSNCNHRAVGRFHSTKKFDRRLVMNVSL
ncbi:hypothetical protein PGTUg99_001607 [Puccinia graminis f. sp. tritici]|uniref:Uncharacterized protein n=1 Tax=Puccinia graminis f. sp. tritici TaxID=56615 RepID=A0A5B0RIX7_PUCGR|nr:hypothetical protein PGTUg99_001607 [Puccinia graminis f. sp. tritici]